MSQVQPVERSETIRRLKPYPDYKDSGIEWLGEIPAHWEVKRLKMLAAVELSNVDKKSVEGEQSVRLCNYTDVYYHERITADMDFMAATATPEQVRRFSLRARDVLITKDSESWMDIAVPAVIAEDLPGVLCGYHLAHIRPGAGVDGVFLSRVLGANGPRDQFQVAANGITRFGLGGDAIRTSLFAMPPGPEQRAIAAFLDRETARIDALLEKKEQLIGLLQEQRGALITRAVTKGLDANVPMNDSGVEWLGEIPAHWGTTFLDKLVDPLRRITYGIVQPGEPDPDGILMVRGQNYSRGWSRPEEIFRVSPDIEGPYRRARLKSGDIVMTIVGAGTGNIAVVPEWLEGANLTQTTARIALDVRKASNRYFAYQMQSVVGTVSVELTVKGAAQPGLNLGHISKYRVVVPPLAEQREIADYLDGETSRFDALVAKIEEAIDRLKELRSALISAAVTGKIDVREEAT